MKSWFEVFVVMLGMVIVTKFVVGFWWMVVLDIVVVMKFVEGVEEENWWEILLSVVLCRVH